MGGIHCAVETLLQHGVDLGVIETTLLYWFIMFCGSNRDVSERKFEQLTGNMHSIASKLAMAMKDLTREIDDDGPTLGMRTLGQKLDRAKSLLGTPLQNLTRSETERQTEMSMRCMNVFYESARMHGFDGWLIENTIFYYWLRLSTLRESVPEHIFQKIERNWTEACKRKDRIMDEFSGFSREKKR
jgi:hypothetical protein